MSIKVFCGIILAGGDEMEHLKLPDKIRKINREEGSKENIKIHEIKNLNKLDKEIILLLGDNVRLKPVEQLHYQAFEKESFAKIKMS